MTSEPSAASPPPPLLRRCANIKSRSNPDVQCPFQATQGDYCLRHSRHPRPYHPGKEVAHPSPSAQNPLTPAVAAAAKRLWTWWIRRAPLLRWRSLGPAANAPTLAMNQTELYTLGPLSSIPAPYFFSFADSRRILWAFDIRSLAHGMASGAPLLNPYTRDPLTATAAAALHRRIEWLRARRYNILHSSTEELTPEQLWNQRVLDAFLRIEGLGYYANCDWFHDLGLYDHQFLYRKLFDLWEWRLGLSAADKERIVPGPAPLFRFPPGSHQEGRDKAWWSRLTLGLFETLLTRAVDRETQKLGALYILMALVQASRPAAAALPWILETVRG